jgi:hypothetical protein
MRDLEHEQAHENVRMRASEIAAGPPSIESFYSLEPFLAYFDLWYEIVDVCRNQWTAVMIRDQWTHVLKSQLSDPMPWFPSRDRSSSFATLLERERLDWSGKPYDRYFEAHHHIASHVEGIAAAHLTLLLEADPVGTIEYVAALPSHHMLWRAVGWLELETRNDLIDVVIASSSSTEAVVLCLATQLDRLCDEARGQQIVPPNVESRLVALTTSAFRRADAGAVAGPWLRHLIHLADQNTANPSDRSPIIAKVALDVSIPALPDTVAVDHLSKPDIACLVTRIMVDRAYRNAPVHWSEWLSLMRAEDTSRLYCGEISFRTVGDALARTTAPLDLWKHAASVMESLFRARARSTEYESEQVASMLIVPALHAAARMKSDGRELWLAAYSLARRQFLIELPITNHRNFRLPSLLFASFHRVFGDNAEMRETQLDLLPTRQHVTQARELLAVNSPEST